MRLNTVSINSRASATDTGIHNKMFWSGNTALIISNEEMNNDIMEN